MFTREVATLDQGLVDSERTGLRTPSELLPYWRAADYPVAIRQGGTPRMDVAGWEAFPSWLPGCPPREKARPPPALFPEAPADARARGP